MLQEPKFCFLDQFHKIGIGYKENGKRKAFEIDIPKDMAKEIFRVFHGGTVEDD